ncbi:MULTISPECIES: NADPH-dependent FMN reductase [unclassified Arcicella]|uniref:NADPH-dependent FMN reductase n=1 Tax=unclassified Arcicella TaxID=2644986 RepID=UPI00285AFFD9|nr:MULTISPECIES: NADPH-dependent FMN reductase [unclassified Arcicella]MDR6560224.1 NAD(P)H-dependent FMN reductase [Arcicella sp. BE51]MDR6810170.1 NAD(P)H-dependent FMN reductase [Arcicella sp. BE140]MDR6821519.1 NAD(P)H-dependent FMN reductase [Arcicella sp. BE139]
MKIKKRILGISGSTRVNSSNHKLLHAIATIFTDQIELSVFDGIEKIPHFNPDIKDAHIDNQVTIFRELISQADGVIICTPEYAHGIPGTLKNAIDWTVGSGEFSGKPTLLITASTDGTSGHKALLEVLKVIEAKNIDQLQLLVQYIRSKINQNGEIIDKDTLSAITRLGQQLIGTIDETNEGKE